MNDDKRYERGLGLSANQIVAWNLMRARGERGLTQEQAAELLEPYLGERWSKATFSAAERSYDGKRVRQFSADDIVAFARAFGLPVSWFFIPPPEEDQFDREAWWTSTLELVFGDREFEILGHRLRMVLEDLEGHDWPEGQRRLQRMGERLNAELAAYVTEDLGVDLDALARDLRRVAAGLDELPRSVRRMDPEAAGTRGQSEEES